MILIFLKIRIIFTCGVDIKHHTPFPLGFSWINAGGMRRLFSGLPARTSESLRHRNCQHPLELEIM